MVTFAQAVNTQEAGRLSIVSELNVQSDGKPSNWNIVLGREVIVPVISSNNPMISLIGLQGISSADLALLIGKAGRANWSEVISTGLNEPVHFILSNDEMIASGIEKYCGAGISSLTGKVNVTAEEVMASVQRDPLAIGFCKLSDLRKAGQTRSLAGISLLSIDKNGNGRMDSFEKIYGNLDEFTNGVWIGKYPNALSKAVYAVAPVQPTEANEVAFLAWVLSDGQNLLNSYGIASLASNEKKSGMNSLPGGQVNEPNLTLADSQTKSWPVWLTIVALSGLFISFVVYSRRSARKMLPQQAIHIAPFLIENAMNVPKGLYFDKSHTWAFMEQDGMVKVGVDDFLQHITGKLTRVRMKEAGEKVRKGEKIMTIMQEGKHLNLYAPISGTIVAHNQSLLTDSSIINTSPFAEGWIYRIEPVNWLREIQFMLMGERYAEWLRDEFNRLREFVAATVRVDNLVYEHVVLQDGGELTDHLLSEMGPEVWEDFQNQFIDTSR